MVSLVPKGVCVDVVGINASDRGRSCSVHAVCGSQLVGGKHGTILRIREVTISINGKDEVALAVHTHSLEDEADGCRVGFLRKHLVEHKESYVNKLLQVTKIYSEESECASNRQKHYRNHGCCRANVMHEVLLDHDVSPLKMEDSPGYLDYLIKLGEDGTPEQQDNKKRAAAVVSGETKKKANNNRTP